ncbi:MULTISPECIES: hypothetical protein [unclassified Microcoleus]
MSTGSISPLQPSARNWSFEAGGRRKEEEGKRKKERGRRKEEEGKRKKEGARRRKEPEEVFLQI